MTQEPYQPDTMQIYNTDGGIFVTDDRHKVTHLPDGFENAADNFLLVEVGNERSYQEFLDVTGELPARVAMRPGTKVTVIPHPTESTIEGKTYPMHTVLSVKELTAEEYEARVEPALAAYRDERIGYEARVIGIEQKYNDQISAHEEQIKALEAAREAETSTVKRPTLEDFLK